MCDEARTAGTLHVDRATLAREKREHPDWWIDDDYIALGFDGMHRPPESLPGDDNISRFC